MADFWIKIEKSTPDKPEIFEMADLLNIDPDAVMGKLIRVWSWMDSNSENGHIKNVTPVLIDRVTITPGFADALKKVGWLAENNIPNFDRHLGSSAKKRTIDAERKRLSRSTSKECPKEIVTEVVLDKSRVDKKEISNSSSEDKTKVKKSSADKFTFEDFAIAEQMFADLILFNPGHKKPNLESWANEIRKMREIDKRSISDIGYVWHWARQDQFWQKNILSPSKLRDKFDQLNIKRKENTNGTSKQHNQKEGLLNRVHRETREALAAIDAREAGEDLSCVVGADESVVSTQMGFDERGESQGNESEG